MPISTSDLVTSDAQFVSDGFTITGVLARPVGAVPAAPAVVILHEWWGVSDHMKDLTRRFAKEGYAALVPDLYSRMGHKVTADAAEAGKLMSALSSQQVLRDLNAAMKFLKQQPGVDPVRLCAIGFCMGGTFAITLALQNSDIKASVAFYGKVPPVESFKYQLCPILYHYGAKDGWVTKQEVDILSQGLRQYRKPGEVVTYPEAGHAFFNDTRPDAYRPTESAQAWQRTLRFLAQHVR
jgi:carboxymethylenebutenolidase